MRYFFLLLFVMNLIFGCSQIKPEKPELTSLTPFGVCYSKLSPKEVAPYKMVIVEPDFYNSQEIKSLKETGTRIFGYVTLGEVDPNRWYFNKMEELGFRGENKIWQSSYLDLKNPAVRSLLLDQVIPAVVDKGMDGLFLDTIDAVSPETERADLQPYMAELIRSLRLKYPNLFIIQNAGLFLLDRTGPYIDAFLTESLASDYDFENREYLIRADSVFNQRLGYLNEYIRNTEIPFLILDYAGNPIQVQQIRSRLDTLGRPYFISNIALSKLPEKVDSVANRLTQGR